MWHDKHIRQFVYFWLFVIFTLVLCAFAGAACAAQTPPRDALKHRQELTRMAHEVWGLNAPIPVFAAQITQESAWNTQAISKAGAVGMAQFMPGTAKWWCDLNKLSALECQPTNPRWAMRALVGYDLWLYKRVWGLNEYDRMHAALRAYNGGLGHWQKEASIAGSRQRALIDAACGKARRHPLHCKENLNYPHRILNVYQSRYYGWGRGIMMSGGTA